MFLTVDPRVLEWLYSSLNDRVGMLGKRSTPVKCKMLFQRYICSRPTAVLGREYLGLMDEVCRLSRYISLDSRYLEQTPSQTWKTSLYLII